MTDTLIDRLANEYFKGEERFRRNENGAQAFRRVVGGEIDRLTQELDQAQEQVVWGFYEEEKPHFEQGKKGWHELTSPVSKEEVQGYVDKIEELKGIIRTCAETFRRYQRNHTAKVAPPYTGSEERRYDSLEKARVNWELAEMCEQALGPRPIHIVGYSKDSKLVDWPVAIMAEPEREWEGRVVAPTVEAAVNVALKGFALQQGELLHMIHVGVPKQLNSNACPRCNIEIDPNGTHLCEDCGLKV